MNGLLGEFNSMLGEYKGEFSCEVFFLRCFSFIGYCILGFGIVFYILLEFLKCLVNECVNE